MSFIDDAQITIQALHEYERESMSQEVPVIHQRPMAELVTELGLATWVRDGGLHGRKLAQFLDTYLSAATRLHHPGYLAHQVAIPHYAGALGSLIDGFTNNAMAIYEMGPAAASIEYFMVNWLLGKVGWQAAPLPGYNHGTELSGGGVLTHGGSLANLTALTAARSRLVPQVWQDGNPDDLALLAPQGAHYSIARAAGILGIGSRAVYELEVDGEGKVIPERLAAAHQRLQDDGKRAVALVANACSTAVGIYDPLDEIADFCRERDLWFHIDGAHGASALLSHTHRKLLRGVEKADSLVWDAHKMVRTPTVCAAVLVRDHRALDAAFQQEASYIFHAKEQPGFDFIQRTVECTKAGLGLRLFLTLAALGEKRMEAYIDRQFAVTLAAYEYLQTLPDIDCPVKPQANILCFRLQGDDALQIRVRDQLIAAGHFYPSTTSFAGRRYLRAVFMNPQTSLEHIKQLIAEIRGLAA